jgi:hypothetical protein
MPIQTLSVAREKTVVALILNGRRVMAMPWQTADELRLAIREQTRAARAGTVTAEITIRSGSAVLSVRHEGGLVLLIGDGRLLIDMPPIIAERLWRSILVQARKAEEVAKAGQIALDQALLIRSGAFFGLTDHPVIRAEAIKEAGHNRLLRSAIPSIRSTEVFGVPVVSHETRSPYLQLRDLAARMPRDQRRAVLATLAKGP